MNEEFDEAKFAVRFLTWSCALLTLTMAWAGPIIWHRGYRQLVLVTVIFLFFGIIHALKRCKEERILFFD